MAAKLTNTGKPKLNAEAFLPSLITFGPGFMLMGLSHGIISGVNRPGWFAATGTLMLMFGLLALYSKQRHIERWLDELERLKN